MSSWIDTCLIHLRLPIFDPLSEVDIENFYPHSRLGKLEYTTCSSMSKEIQTIARRGLLFGPQNVRYTKKNVVYYKIRNKDQNKWMTTRSDENNRSLRVTQPKKKKGSKINVHNLHKTQENLTFFLRNDTRWPSFLLQTPGKRTPNNL